MRQKQLVRALDCSLPSGVPSRLGSHFCSPHAPNTHHTAWYLVGAPYMSTECIHDGNSLKTVKVPGCYNFPSAASPSPTLAPNQHLGLGSLFPESFQRPGKFYLAMGEMRSTKMKPTWSCPQGSLKMPQLGKGRWASHPPTPSRGLGPPLQQPEPLKKIVLVRTPTPALFSRRSSPTHH